MVVPWFSQGKPRRVQEKLQKEKNQQNAVPLPSPLAFPRVRGPVGASSGHSLKLGVSPHCATRLHAAKGTQIARQTKQLGLVLCFFRFVFFFFRFVFFFLPENKEHPATPAQRMAGGRLL